MKVKGVRILKNGTKAGYVKQKDGSWKWRFISGKTKMKGGSIDVKKLIDTDLFEFYLKLDNKINGNLKTNNGANQIASLLMLNLFNLKNDNPLLFRLILNFSESIEKFIDKNYEKLENLENLTIVNMKNIALYQAIQKINEEHSLNKKTKSNMKKFNINSNAFKSILKFFKQNEKFMRSILMDLQLKKIENRLSKKIQNEKEKEEKDFFKRLNPKSIKYQKELNKLSQKVPHSNNYNKKLAEFRKVALKSRNQNFSKNSVELVNQYLISKKKKETFNKLKKNSNNRINKVSKGIQSRKVNKARGVASNMFEKAQINYNKKEKLSNINKARGIASNMFEKSQKNYNKKEKLSNINKIKSVNNIINYHNNYDINVIEPNTPPPPQEPHPNNRKNQTILKKLLWSLYQSKRSHKNNFLNLNTETKINKILNQQLKNSNNSKKQEIINQVKSLLNIHRNLISTNFSKLNSIFRNKNELFNYLTATETNTPPDPNKNNRTKNQRISNTIERVTNDYPNNIKAMLGL